MSEQSQTSTELSSPAKKGKKVNPGRNLPVAIAVGVVLASLAFGSLLYFPQVFVALVALLVARAVWELSRSFSSHGVNIAFWPLVVGGVGTLLSAYLLALEAALAATLLTALVTMLYLALFPRSRLQHLRDLTASIMALMYGPFLASFVLLILAEHGSYKVLLYMLCVVASDTGGYAFGVLFGKHPMSPSISPKKTWEGFAGSLILGVATGVAGAYLTDLSWYWGITIGVVCVFSAIIGDLAESLLKRDVGIKDMGALLPGHGGVLDRVDSLLMTAPFAYIIFRLAQNI